MSLEAALRVSELLLAVATLQQCAEHLTASSRFERSIFALRGALALLLLSGFFPEITLLALVAISIVCLLHFDGVYNGGSDRMGLLILWILCAARLAPTPLLAEVFFGYLGLQLVLSDAISGWVKLRNDAWRSGAALQDVFAFSAYPVSRSVRNLAKQPRLILMGSWTVILFEALFPLSVLSLPLLLIALLFGFGFHLANACLFGLNRFVWVWLAAHPSLIWLQMRLF